MHEAATPEPVSGGVPEPLESAPVRVAFLLSGTQQSAWSFSAFFGGMIAISLIMTPLFNASRGSILLSAFMHFQLMNPIWPDAQPYDTYMLIVVALIVVVLKRRTVVSRIGAVTQVIPDADS